jgi:hypothetical protein
MRTGLFPGVKQLGLGVNYPPPSIAEVKERVELYLYSVFITGYGVEFALYSNVASIDYQQSSNLPTNSVCNIAY